MRIWASIGSWLGFGDDAGYNADEVPRWNGVPHVRVVLIQLGWIFASIAMFVFLNSEVPSEDGLGGYVPLIMSAMFLALGVTFTERLLLKSRSEGEIHHATSNSH